MTWRNRETGGLFADLRSALLRGLQEEFLEVLGMAGALLSGGFLRLLGNGGT